MRGGRRVGAIGGVIVAALLVGVAVGCDLRGETSSPTPTATATPIVSHVPTVTPSPLFTASTSPSPAVVSPTPLATPSATSLGRLKGLSSYRYTMHWEITGVKSAVIERLGRLAENPNALPDPFVVDAKGATIAPDKLETVYNISGVPGEFAIVVINKQQWLKLPGGAVVGPTAFQGSLDDINEATGFWDGKVLRQSVPISCGGEKEFVNGIPARHCQINRATVQQLTAVFSADIDQARIANSSLDLWLHETEGFPLRVRIALQGTDERAKEFRVKLDLDVTDINSPNLQIQPPS